MLKEYSVQTKCIYLYNIIVVIFIFLCMFTFLWLYFYPFTIPNQTFNHVTCYPFMYYSGSNNRKRCIYCSQQPLLPNLQRTKYLCIVFSLKRISWVTGQEIKCLYHSHRYTCTCWLPIQGYSKYAVQTSLFASQPCVLCVLCTCIHWYRAHGADMSPQSHYVTTTTALEQVSLLGCMPLRTACWEG